jgi:Bacterial Ig-like domain (group 2)
MIDRHLMIGMSIALFAGTTGCGANCYQPFSGDPIPGCLERKWDREMAARGGEVGSISLSAVSDSLEVGQMLVLDVDVRPPAGKEPPGPSVFLVWTSSDSTVATVASGSVFAKHPGVATISATAKGVVGAKTITVTAAHK